MPKKRLNARVDEDTGTIEIPVGTGWLILDKSPDDGYHFRVIDGQDDELFDVQIEVADFDIMFDHLREVANDVDTGASPYANDLVITHDGYFGIVLDEDDRTVAMAEGEIATLDEDEFEALTVLPYRIGASARADFEHYANERIRQAKEASKEARKARKAGK